MCKWWIILDWEYEVLTDFMKEVDYIISFSWFLLDICLDGRIIYPSFICFDCSLPLGVFNRNHHLSLTRCYILASLRESNDAINIWRCRCRFWRKTKKANIDHRPRKKIHIQGKKNLLRYRCVGPDPLLRFPHVPIFYGKCCSCIPEFMVSYAVLALYSDLACLVLWHSHDSFDVLTSELCCEINLV